MGDLEHSGNFVNVWPFQLTANIEGEGAEFVFFFNLKLLAINVPNVGRKVGDKREFCKKGNCLWVDQVEAALSN